jgi:hypothetical protein
LRRPRALLARAASRRARWGEVLAMGDLRAGLPVPLLRRPSVGTDHIWVTDLVTDGRIPAGRDERTRRVRC